jgi:hypothetical protein
MDFLQDTKQVQVSALTFVAVTMVKPKVAPLKEQPLEEMWIECSLYPRSLSGRQVQDLQTVIGCQCWPLLPHAVLLSSMFHSWISPMKWKKQFF